MCSNFSKLQVEPFVWIPNFGVNKTSSHKLLECNSASKKMVDCKKWETRESRDWKDIYFNIYIGVGNFILEVRLTRNSHQLSKTTRTKRWTHSPDSRNIKLTSNTNSFMYETQSDIICSGSKLRNVSAHDEIRTYTCQNRNCLRFSIWIKSMPGSWMPV